MGGAARASSLVRTQPRLLAPVAGATGTDLSTGSRLAFFQSDFDLLCSDLSRVRLSRAAAASSAVPGVLSPVTLNNYGGTCGYQYPAWVSDVAKLRGSAWSAGRTAQRHREMEDAEASVTVPKLSLTTLDVSFDAILDPEERAYFMRLPTSFVLPAEDVDRLREVAGRLTRDSPAFQSVVREFGGVPAK
jgi:hypothetical protein